MDFSLPIGVAGLSGKKITMRNEVSLSDVIEHLKFVTASSAYQAGVSADGYIFVDPDRYNQVSVSGNQIIFGDYIGEGPVFSTIAWV